ncbi:MAG TPA: hypothetical protein DCL21_03105 [Alphaproteobacteria bacterium]|nr:hypothetical protein [Alphaproteobacteria bacterium]
MLNKKGAMFGLEAQVLEKQSGELFLARLRRLTLRLVEGHQASKVQTAKGAMFGLDARIALAIFGALSVISGAALYNAIKQAKVIKYVTQLEELNKAYEAYRLDTGEDLALFLTNRSQLNIGELKTSSKAGWQGPYVSFDYVISGAVNYFFVDSLQQYYFNLWKDSDWGWDATTPISPGDCTANDTCIIYISLQNIDLTTVQAIDEYVDGSISPKTGKIRRWGSNAIYYKINRLM